jgi:uncharacterized membrane protein
MVREADPEATAEALAPFEGKINYTYLPAETEAKLREVLSKRD